MHPGVQNRNPLYYNDIYYWVCVDLLPSSKLGFISFVEAYLCRRGAYKYSLHTVSIRLLYICFQLKVIVMRHTAGKDEKLDSTERTESHKHD